MTKQNTNPKRHWITLQAPHTHRGEDHAPGDLLELREDQAARLIEAEIARPATEAELKQREQA